MENSNKAIWQVMAFFPWMLVFAVFVIDLLIGVPPLAKQSLPGIVIYISMAVALLVIWVAFIGHAWKNEQMIDDDRLKWSLSLFFFSVFVYPVYWWKYIENLEPKLYESSTSFDKENVKPFLEKLSKAIDSGLDVMKVDELLEFTFDAASDDQKQTTFHVTHNGKNETIAYSVYADDIDSYVVCFFTSKELVALIDAEMDILFEELGM